MNDKNQSDLSVAVIGAGPVGVAAAVHLFQRGLKPLIFEQGSRVGSSMREWGHVRLFSPWSECLDEVSVQLLERGGWERPPADNVPTGAEIVERYLEPLAGLPEIEPNVRFSTRVIAVGRQNLDKVRATGREKAPFVIHVEGANNQRLTYLASAVIDASGTWGTPNPLGAGGIPAKGESELADRLWYGIPDVLGVDTSRFASRNVLVVGSGHSAANALIDLARLKKRHPNTEISWAIRRSNPERTYGGEDADELEHRGELGKRLHALVDERVLSVIPSFRTTGVTHDDDGFRIAGLRHDQPTTLFADEVIVATGFRPDLSFLREVRLSLDCGLECSRALASLIDPNVHSCGTVKPHGERELRHDESGFYVAGMKSYGRAPTFLLPTGYEQVRSIAASLSGDQTAADRIELCLPESGVCSSNVVEFADDLAVQ